MNAVAVDRQRDPARRQHLQRVPPHDDAVEQALLGAAMLSRDGAELVAELGPVWYRPSHALIADTVRQLVAESKIADSGTVAGMLRSQGQLDGLGTEVALDKGAAYLSWLCANVPFIGASAQYADIVVAHDRARRMLGLASEIVEAVYSRTPTAGLVAELQAQTEAGLEAQTSSWDAVNLAATLAGEGDTATPAMLRRTDGQALLYTGKLHAFNAEPESGKSWLAMWACLEVIEAGGHALYVDFEDDAATAVERLLALGADPAQLLDRFHYMRPDDPVNAAATLRVRAALRAWPVQLCVIDGVGEAMASSGWNEDKAADYFSFANALPRPVRRAGVAVILIDHLPKNRETRGDDARGSGAKRGVVDAALRLEVARPFGRGRDGMAKVIVAKDRHGHLRGATHNGRLIAEMHLTSADAGQSVTLTLRPPPDPGAGAPFRPTEIMAKVSAEVEAAGPLSKRTIRSVIRGKATYVDLAIGLLVAEGYLQSTAKGYMSIRSFDAAADSEPEQEELPMDGGYGEPF